MGIEPVHFLRNALDHLPRKALDVCLQELRWLYDRRDLSEAQKDLTQWLERGKGTRHESYKTLIGLYTSLP